MNTIVIDATNATLGRLASYAAKQALLGKSVVIVNCSEAIISGKRPDILEKYRTRRARGGSGLKGPHFPKQPFRLVKRTIRGMLSYKQKRGEDALKRIICHDKVPTEYEAAKKILAGKEKRTTVIKLSKLSKEI